MFSKLKYCYSILLTTLILMNSCKKANINFGSELLGTGLTDIVKVDSFSANLYTVYMDSFITNNKGILMLGAYNDPIFGKVSTNAYFELMQPTWVQTNQQVYFDSMVMILKPNGTYYGDSTKSIDITINELKDSIAFDENKSFFHNNKSFNIKSPAITTANVKIAPLSKLPITIKLPDALGNTLFNKLRDPNDEDFKTKAKFLNYFKGIRLSSNLNNQFIANCSDDVVWRIYYRQDAVTPQSKSIDFTLANKRTVFNNISVDRTGKVLENLSSINRQISSDATGDIAYAQSTTNTAIKITFPSIRQILKNPNFGKLLKARLIIEPIKSTYDNIFTLPTQLRLSETDVNNRIGFDVFSYGPNGERITQMGNLFIDYALNDNTNYSYDLSEYIKEYLYEANPVNGKGLLLCPPNNSYDATFNRIAIGSQKHNLNNIRLEVYYIAVK